MIKNLECFKYYLLNVTSNFIKFSSGSWLFKKVLGFVYKGSNKPLLHILKDFLINIMLEMALK